MRPWSGSRIMLTPRAVMAVPIVLRLIGQAAARTVTAGQPPVQQTTVQQTTVRQTTVRQTTVRQTTVRQTTVQQTTVRQTTVRQPAAPSHSSATLPRLAARHRL